MLNFLYQLIVLCTSFISFLSTYWNFKERFYVITHDFKGYIEQRLKNVLTSQNLELQEPPKEFSNIYQGFIEQEDMK